MNIFSKLKTRLKTKRASPANKGTNTRTYVQQLLDFLGVDNYGTPEAINEATYFACLRLLSESIGKLPLKLQQYTVEHGVQMLRRDPRFFILGTRPNPYQTATTFWSTVEYNRQHYGNAYVLIRGAGKKMTLWILPSDKVTIVNDDKDLFERGAGKLYYVYSGAKMYTFSDEEILHFKTSSTFDGIAGVSVRDRLKATITGNADAQTMLNKMYKNGYTGKAVLQYTGDINDELVKTYIKGIEAYAKGQSLDEDDPNDISTIIPIPLGSTLTPLNVKLSDGQFIEIKKYSALQIAAAFGIKPNQINDFEKASYASGELQQLAFYVDTLLYSLKQYEEEISYKLLSVNETSEGMYFKFNVATILRADYATQIDTLSKAVNNFLMTPDEAREKLDLGTVKNGDRLIGQGANIFLDQIGCQYGANDNNPPTTSEGGGENNE